MSDLVSRLRIEANASSAVSETDRLHREVVGLGKAAGQAQAGLNQAAAGANAFERRASAAGGAARLLGAALATLGVRELVGQMKDAAFAAQGFETGLGAVAGGASGARAELGFVRGEALRLGLDVRNAASSFLQLSGATNETALAGEQTRQIWTGVATAGLAMGRSNEQVQRGFEAISQIASKGVVSMEEVRQQLAEAIPGATNIAARAMGMTTQEFNKAVEAGEVLATDFLPKFAQQLQRDFGPAVEKYLTSDIGRARVELAELQTQLFDLEAVGGEAFLGGVIDGVSSLNDSLGSKDTAEQVRLLAHELGELAGMGAAGLGALAQHIDAIAAAAGGLAGLGLAKWLRDVAAASGAAVAAARAEAVARAEAAAAALAQARAEAAALASGAAYAQLSTTYAGKIAAVAVAERELAAAQAATSAAALGSRAALSSLLGIVGGPLGIAFLAAGAAAMVYAHNQAEAADRAREMDDRADQLATTLREIDASGLSAATATAEFGENTKAAQTLVEQLTGKAGALAEKYYDVAAAAKTAAINQLMAQSAAVGMDADNLEAQLAAKERDRGRAAMQGLSFGMGIAFAPTVQAKSAEDDATRQTIQQKRALQAQAQQRANQLMNIPLTDPRWGGEQAIGGAASNGGGKTKTDRAGNLAKDLESDVIALTEYRAALAAGGKALDDWQVADAGRQAVERAGLTHRAKLTAAETVLAARIRESAEEVERMRLASERVERAVGLQRTADEDAAALKRRSEAAASGLQALEDLAVKEAGLDAMRQIGIQTLDQLTGADRRAAEAAIAAAEARERQAIATQKAERVGVQLRDLDERIASEKALAVAIAGGTKAEVDYARAEFVRQQVERAGENLTADQIRQIKAKAEALFEAGAAADMAKRSKDEAEELQFARLTNREREIERRILEIRVGLLAAGVAKTEEEAEARARSLALAEQAAADDARAIGALKQNLRDAFVETGRLSFDDVADYAEQRLREAIYDSLLAKPIEVIINAVVGNVRGLEGAIGKAAGGRAGALLGSAGVGYAVGSGMGLGTGNQAADMGLALAGSVGGSMLVGTGIASAIGSVGTSAALGLGASTVGAGVFGAMLSSAAVMGPIAAIAALALGTLLKSKPSNNGAIATLSGDTYSLGGNKSTGETRQAVEAAAQGYLAGVEILDEAGIKITDAVRQFDLGTRDQTHIILQSGKELRSAVGDPAAAAETALKAVLQGATFVDEAQKNLVLSMVNAGAGFDQIAATLEGYRAAQALPQQIADAIQQLTDPKAYAIGQLERQQQDRRDQIEAARDAGFLTAEQFAAVTTQLERLEDLELDKVLEQFGEAAKNATDRLKEAEDLRTSVSGRILELQDPAAYRRKQINDEIDAQRAQAEALIAAGAIGPEILGQLEVLRGLELGRLMEELAGGVGKAADAFEEARPKLRQWLDQVGLSAAAELSPEEQRKAALDLYQKTLAKARSGDADALSSITGIADQLFSADRAATSSAEARRALYDQVTADIAGLAGMSGGAKGATEALAGLGVSLGLLASNSNKQVELQQSLLTAGGSLVTIGNLPDIQTMTATVLGQQTLALTAANDRTHAEQLTALRALQQQVQDSILSLQASLGETMGGQAAALEALAARIEAMGAGLSDMANEQRLTNNQLRVQSGRRS